LPRDIFRIFAHRNQREAGLCPNDYRLYCASRYADMILRRRSNLVQGMMIKRSRRRSIIRDNIRDENVAFGVLKEIADGKNSEYSNLQLLVGLTKCCPVNGYLQFLKISLI